jgi:hypothetical protein
MICLLQYVNMPSQFSQCIRDNQMMYRWTDVNIDLSLVANVIREFFETEGFKTRIDESGKEYTVLAVKRVNDESKSLSVKIRGRQDDFIVEFSTASLAHSLAMLGPLVTLSGFGVILQREMKRSDFFRKTEENFWTCIDDAISKFKTSSKNH